MRRAIFFDRDGVINKLVPRSDGRCTSPWSLSEFMLLPRVREAVALVAPHYDCFVITNQPHVGHETTTHKLAQIHQYLQHEVPGIVEISYCSDQGSSHYKPGHGMVIDLLNKYQLTTAPRHHYMIGDRWKDVVCGYRSGLTTIYVGDKYECGEYANISPDYIVPDIYAACELIMEQTS